MKKITIGLIVSLISAYAYCGEQLQNSLKLEYGGQYKYLVNVTYINLSSVAQCIRSDDMAFKFLGDFLLAKNEKGDQLASKSSDNDSSHGAQSYPSSYVIIPPGKSNIGSFYLNDYYKLKGKEIVLKMQLPLIPCEYPMMRFQRIPTLASLKRWSLAGLNIDGHYDDETKEGYPDWTNSGLLAVSNELKIKL